MDTLQQLHVLFRHGDRAPDRGSMYPTDPNKGDLFEPNGLGQLTNLGQKQVYNIGKTLREKYDQFLGDIYTPDVLEAKCTDVPRTKASVLLVLAGLWPPAQSQTFEKKMPWQPIPYSYEKYQSDTLLANPIFRKIPEYDKEYEDANSSGWVKRFFLENKELINYINKNSGWDVTTFQKLSELYSTLYAEDQTSRILPKWTKKVYPDFLENAAAQAYIVQTSNDIMLKYSSGAIIKKIITDAKSKKEGSLEPKEKKIFLYSAHEYNIAHVLNALKAFEPHVPNYASYLLFELHKIGTEYGFKIYHQDGPERELELIRLPNCDEFCSINQFEQQMANILPE